MKFLPCHVCGKDFSKTAYLNKHLKIHDEISVHNCNLCDKKFKTKQSLYQHKQSHVSRNNISCHKEGCNRLFTTKQGLDKHVNTKHKYVTFPCPNCDKKFSCENYCKEHMRKCKKTKKRKVPV